MTQLGNAARVDRSWRPFFVGGLVFAGVALLALIVVCGVLAGSGGRTPWYLLLLATAAAAAGALCGFLYSTFGSEEKKFGDAFKVANGAIGGFAVADLLNDDSWIVRALRALAVPAGDHVGIGVVVTVVLTFGTVGFFFLYFAKKIVLNPMTAVADKLVAANSTMNAATPPLVMPGEAEGQPPTDEVIEAAAVLREAAEPARNATVAELKATAKAYYVAGEWGRAGDALRRAYRSDPKDPETLLYLANVIINYGRPTEAIRYLEELAALPTAPAVTWKLLGYSYLFRRDKLDDAARASRRYLEAFPGDVGALLNLTCALAQPGPEANPHYAEVLREVRNLTSSGEAVARQIRRLTQDGEDFSLWVDNSEFRVAAGLDAA
jgi:tetratricopeptide (TPR) repeat protein